MRDNCCTPGLALSCDSQSAAAMPICGEAFCSEAPDYFAGSRINHISLRIIEDFLGLIFWGRFSPMELRYA
jgi:hypothetical protein